MINKLEFMRRVFSAALVKTISSDFRRELDFNDFKSKAKEEFNKITDNKTDEENIEHLVSSFAYEAIYDIHNKLNKRRVK
jgi:hypothetical protein